MPCRGAADNPGADAHGPGRPAPWLRLPALGAALLIAACGRGAPPERAPGGQEAPAAATRPDRGAQPASPGFERTLTRQGITFRVSCPNASSLNTLRLLTEGLGEDAISVSRQVDGSVAGAEAADLDADGLPEVYVFVQSAGSGSYGSLVALAAGSDGSLSEIHLPPVSGHPEAAQGYMGHDAFGIAEGRLVRRFPTYVPDDVNAAPTGRTRRMEYRLVPGPGGLLLQLERVAEE